MSGAGGADGAPGGGNDGLGGLGGFGGLGLDSATSAASGLADSISSALSGLSDAVGSAIGDAVSSLTGDEGFGQAVADAVSAALTAAVIGAFSSALGPLGSASGAVLGLPTLSDITETAIGQVAANFDLDLGQIDNLQQQVSALLGDTLNTNAGIPNLMDQLGVPEAIANPFAFANLEADLKHAFAFAS